MVRIVPEHLVHRHIGDHTGCDIQVFRTTEGNAVGNEIPPVVTDAKVAAREALWQRNAGKLTAAIGANDDLAQTTTDVDLPPEDKRITGEKRLEDVWRRNCESAEIQRRRDARPLAVRYR